MHSPGLVCALKPELSGHADLLSAEICGDDLDIRKAAQADVPSKHATKLPSTHPQGYAAAEAVCRYLGIVQGCRSTIIKITIDLIKLCQEDIDPGFNVFLGVRHGQIVRERAAGIQYLSKAPAKVDLTLAEVSVQSPSSN
jgi:hypothetical protein